MSVRTAYDRTPSFVVVPDQGRRTKDYGLRFSHLVYNFRGCVLRKGPWSILLAAWMAAGVPARDTSNRRAAFGGPSVFNTALCVRPMAARLTSGALVATYADMGNARQGTAILGSLGGRDIGFGSKCVFNPAGTGYPMVAALGPDKFVTIYPDEGNGRFGTAVIGSVSGGNVTYGAETVFNRAYSPYHSVCALGADKFVAVYRDDGSGWAGTAVVGTLSGTAIAFGSAQVFHEGITQYTWVAPLSSDRLAIVYQRDYSHGSAVIATVSGSDISFGPEHEFCAGGPEQISVAALDSDAFVVGYRDVGDASAGHARVGIVSGSEISFGPECAFGAEAVHFVSLATLSPSRFVVAYRDDARGGTGTARIGTRTGDTIAFAPPLVFHAGPTSNPFVISMNSTSWVVLYLDDKNARFGTAVLYR